jgi:hypothetical protein
MTLNITLLGEEAIYQSADFRLVDGETGDLITDSSSKIVIVGEWDWNGSVTYTGVGRWRGKSTSDLLVDWLTEQKVGPEELVGIIEERGTAWLKRIHRDTGKWLLHSFVVAAFPAGRPTAWVISNFEDVRSLPRPTPAESLSVSDRSFRGAPQIIVTGQKPSVDRATRRRLQRAASGRPDPGRIRRLLAEANEAAAKNPPSHDTVSAGCSVASIRSEGQGVTEILEGSGIDPRRITSGIPYPAREDIEKLLGGQLDGMELVATYQAATPPTKSLDPCRPVHRSETASGYALHEIAPADLESNGAVDISESGLILGNGRQPDTGGRRMPWLSRRGEEPDLCGFIGEAVAVNEDGVVAATVEEDGLPMRALRWHGSSGEELDDFKGGATAAAAISDDGTLVGNVCIDPQDPGQHSLRPAAWLPDGDLKVLEDFAFEWGMSSAISGSDVLVWAHRGRETHTLLWSLERADLREVGEPGVMPVDLTDSGFVLGSGRDGDEVMIPVLSRQGQPWKGLGDLRGGSANAMAESGDIVGTSDVQGFARPWVRRAAGDLIWLPYFGYHSTVVKAVNSSGWMVGYAGADHGTHALVWKPDDA